MKKRILFVDDEEMILLALKETLQPVEDQWEMHFVNNGADALALMEKAPCDAIVADMRMPNMTGAQLLHETMKRHPGTVRFILSGYMDRKEAMKCAASAHQFLTKPFHVTELQTTINRTLNLGIWMGNKSLQKLVSQLSAVPSLPSLYLKIIEELKSSDASVEDIVQIISHDTGMAAKVLQVVNSSFLGLHHQVVDLKEAVQLLGMEMLRNLILYTKFFQEYHATSSVDFSVEELSNHSFSIAVMAREIVHMESGDKGLANEAFSAGLLHDIGQWVLVSNLPAEYQRACLLVEKEGLTMLEAEHEVFGATHTEVGGYLLGLWGLPFGILEAVALHHSPLASHTQKFCALTAVHVADAIERMESMEKSDSIHQVDVAYLEQLGLSGRLKHWRKSLRQQILAQEK